MKKLTKKEIKFIRETGWSPTLVQMNYSEIEMRVPFFKRFLYENLKSSDAESKYLALAEKYDIDLNKLYKKTCNLDNCDGISLEYDATYLLYTFFTSEELVDLNVSWALKWLQDFKYYFGYRKWNEHFVEIEIEEALEIYAGTREFYKLNGEMWNRKVETDE